MFPLKFKFHKKDDAVRARPEPLREVNVVSQFKKTLYIRVIIFFLIITGGIGGFVFGKQKINIFVESIQALRGEMQWIDKNFYMLAVLRQGRSKAAILSDSLKEALPLSEGIPQKLSRDVQDYAGKYGVKTTVEFGSFTASEENAPIALLFTLRGEGIFLNIMNFLDEFEKQKRVVKVSKINISQKTETISQFIIEGMFYMRPKNLEHFNIIKEPEIVSPAFPESQKQNIPEYNLSSSSVITPFPTATSFKIRILETPTGYLNVRSAPNISASILTKIFPGEEFIVLESREGWYAILISQNIKGWISVKYAKMIQ